MPTITVRKKEVTRLIGKKLSDTTLKEDIPMMGVNIEEFSRDEMTLEITPNRPDLLSEEGFSRALKSFLGIKPGLKEYHVKKGNVTVIVDKNLKNIRPYTTCAVVRNIPFTDEKLISLIQAQEKLHATFCRKRRKIAIGVYPLENIMEPIYFKAMKPDEILFTPLDESEVMNGNEILEKHPKGKEYARLLHGYEKFPVFIDSGKNILSMPPIINSAFSGKINLNTKDVFIETSGFNMKEQEKCLNMLVTILADMGGEIETVEIIYGSKKEVFPNLKPMKKKIPFAYANKLIGLNLKDNEIKKLLRRMGFGVEKDNLLVPPWRTDILHPIDIVEEVAIAYRYDALIPELPHIATIASEKKEEKLKEKFANSLIGFGLQEVITFHLTSKKIQDDYMGIDSKSLQVENALSSEWNILRSWLLPQLLHVLKNNTHNEYPQNIFELGDCFSGAKEESHVSVVLAHAAANFTEIKQIVGSFLAGIKSTCQLKPQDHPSFIPGRCVAIEMNKHEIGYLGEIHPRVLEKFDIEMPVSAVELNLESIFKESN